MHPRGQTPTTFQRLPRALGELRNVDSEVRLFRDERANSISRSPLAIEFINIFDERFQGLALKVL